MFNVTTKSKMRITTDGEKIILIPECIDHATTTVSPTREASERVGVNYKL